MLRGYNPVRTKIYLPLLSRCPYLVLWADEDRNDESAPCRLDSSRKGILVAGMNDGAGYGFPALCFLNELSKGIPVAKLKMGGLDGVVEEMRGGRLHRHRTGHELLSCLVYAAAVEDHKVALLTLFPDSDLRCDSVPHSQLTAEPQITVPDLHPRTRQTCAEENGNEGLCARRLRLSGLLTCIPGAGRFEINSIDASRNHGGHVDLVLFQRDSQLVSGAHLNFVKGNIR